MHACAHEALHDDGLSPMQRLRLGLGLLRVVDDFRVAETLGFFLEEQSDPAVEPGPALALLDRLELPPDAGRPPSLRAALAAQQSGRGLA